MMILIYVLGISLIASGLFLLCHHGYTHMNNVPEQGKQSPDEEGLGKEGQENAGSNDCCVPICFFRVSELYNHETWIVVCLLCGSTVLLMSLVPSTVI